MYPTRSRYAARSLTLTNVPRVPGGRQQLSSTAVSSEDMRIMPKGQARSTFSFTRFNIRLLPVGDSPAMEYEVPDLVLNHPNPAIALQWNPGMLIVDSNPNPPEGHAYLYRTRDIPPKQRVRLGKPVEYPKDIVQAVWYVVDYTV